VVGCVQRQYAPFDVDIVDVQPRGGHYITAVIGGRASQLGLDDRVVNGVGPFNGEIERDAVVHVFSKVGTGEHDVENLCAVTAHEVGHALGLEHERYCGDIMSYYLDRCGARRFVDADAPCGEDRVRACQSGARGQNSYRRLGELVGYRDTPARDPEPSDDPGTEATPQDPYADPPRVERPPAIDPYGGPRIYGGRHHQVRRVRRVRVIRYRYWIY
jgi:hypothetical protein